MAALQQAEGIMGTAKPTETVDVFPTTVILSPLATRMETGKFRIRI